MVYGRDKRRLGEQAYGAEAANAVVGSLLPTAEPVTYKQQLQVVNAVWAHVPAAERFEIARMLLAPGMPPRRLGDTTGDWRRRYGLDEATS